MSFRSALFVAEPGRDPAPALAVLGRVAPRLEHLVLILPLPPRLGTRRTRRTTTSGGADQTSESTARAAAAAIAPSFDVQRAAALDGAALAARCIAEDADLLVFASLSLRSAAAVAALRGRLPVPVLWADGPAGTGPIKHVACIALDDRAQAAVEVYLRDHAEPGMHIALLAPTAVPPDAIAIAREVSSIAAEVEVSAPHDTASVRSWLDDWMRIRPLDLVVCAGIPMTVLVGAVRTVPTLLVAPLPAGGLGFCGPLEMADVVDDGGPLRVRVETFAASGRLTPVPDGELLAFVAGGRVVATTTTRGSEAELPAGLGVSALGVSRADANAVADRVPVAPHHVAVVRPGLRPLVLFDAEIANATMQVLVREAAHADADVLAIRMRPTRSCRAIRSRLRAAGLPAIVLDARSVLDEGDAFDVSDLIDPVRLARVACQLRRAGFAVAAIVHRGAAAPISDELAALGPLELDAGVGALRSAIAAASRPASEFAITSQSTIAGNRIVLELDNATARQWLLEAIAGSTKTFHLQVYMALDDDVGAPVEAALAAAAARGVTVRVLVDSLHGKYGSFGTDINALLARLATRPGVELRVVRPITELPSLIDLKLRDHRKLAIADGRLALIGGRNLSHEYYTGFDEVRITAASQFRDVPWLDAGARVEGPAVAALEASFREAWREAGGAELAVAVPPSAGTTAVRVVVHRGLRDARTLETYRELIDGARSHVYVVNGFPFALELQHALLRALRRGVRVRVLSGHVTPTHASGPFRGPGSSARTAATAFVHSRLDPVVAEGGDVYLFAQRDVPGWAEGLGGVQPHVHAKALSVDGRTCTVGSANLDVTASYWESEIVLLVDDGAAVRELEAKFDALMAASVRVDRDDPVWQRLARRRAWMRHWPGALSI